MNPERATLLALYLEDCARELLVFAAHARGYAAGTADKLAEPSAETTLVAAFAWVVAHGLSAIPAYQHYQVGALADRLELRFPELIAYARTLNIGARLGRVQ